MREECCEISRTSCLRVRDHGELQFCRSWRLSHSLANATNPSHCSQHAGLVRPDSSSHCHDDQDRDASRRARSHRRISSSETSAADPESISKEGAEAPLTGPHPAGSRRDARCSSTCAESRSRRQTHNAFTLSPSAGPTKVSMAVFREDPPSPWTPRPIRATGCRRPRDQAPQSALRLPPHRPADFARLRPGNR